MANSTVVYTTALTRFTIGRRAFSTDTINVYYSTNTTSPAPADVLTGAVLVDPGAYTVEGIGARADAFVIDWPAAPTSGTLIVDVESAIGRISNFPDNQLPSGAALNREFDHIITLSGDNTTDITALDVRVTANEGDITALDGRLTTAESDIDALEAWRSGTVDPTLTSHGNRLTAVEGRATALEGRATDLEAADVDLQNQINQLVVDAGEIPPVGGGDIAKVLLVTNDGLGTEAYDWQQVDTSGIADDAVTAAKLADDASVDSNRAVTTDHIRDDAVTAAKLADDASVDGNRAVTTNHIRDLAVDGTKIADLAVTAPKLKIGSVSKNFSMALSGDAVVSAVSGFVRGTDFPSTAIVFAVAVTAGDVVASLRGSPIAGDMYLNAAAEQNTTTNFTARIWYFDV